MVLTANLALHQAVTSCDSMPLHVYQQHLCVPCWSHFGREVECPQMTVWLTATWAVTHTLAWCCMMQLCPCVLNHTLLSTRSVCGFAGCFAAYGRAGGAALDAYGMLQIPCNLCRLLARLAAKSWAEGDRPDHYLSGRDLVARGAATRRYMLMF